MTVPPTIVPRRASILVRLWIIVVLLLIVGVLRLFYPGLRTSQIIRQLEAEHGEIVGWDPLFEEQSPPLTTSLSWAREPCPTFLLVRFLGIHGDQHQITDENMHLIGELFSLTYSSNRPRSWPFDCSSLTLNPSEVSDAGLRHLTGLTQLEVLKISSNRITDRGVAYLGTLKNLTDLRLRSEHLTDVSLARLSNLHKLESLEINGGQIEGHGLKHLAKMTRLEVLDLSGNQVGDQGLKHLADMSHLEVLNLSWTKVGDQGLLSLEHLPKLRGLTLLGTRITDASLPVLGRMKGLKHLVIDETQITEQGRQYLREALPDAKFDPVENCWF